MPMVAQVVISFHTNQCTACLQILQNTINKVKNLTQVILLVLW